MSSEEEFDRNRKYYLAVQYLIKLKDSGVINRVQLRKGYLADSLYLAQCREIDRQLQDLRTEKEILFDTQLESTYTDIKKLTSIVEDYGQEMTCFDVSIFESIVQSITISPDGIIEFTLIGGLHFSERL